MRPGSCFPAAIALLLCWMLLSSGCTDVPGEGEAPLIVVSIPPLATFVEAVGGEQVEVKTLLPPRADPHTYELTPGDLKDMSQADLLILVGSGYPFEDRLVERWQELRPDLPRVNTSMGIPLYDQDPHVWLSPKNARTMVGTIRDALCSLDPSQCEQFTRRGEQYQEELEQLDRSLRSRLELSSRKQFIVVHPAWGYFAREYGLTQLAIEEEGKEASAAHLASLIDSARREGIRIVITDPQFRSREAEVLAGAINGTVVQIDPLSRDYAESLDRMAEVVMGRG